MGMGNKLERTALLDVLAGRPAERRPVWFMRQAGRYLPEYRAARAEAGSFLALCYDARRAAEVTVQPLRRFDLDAAIIFADILVVPHAMGVSLSFREGEGPVLGTVSSLQEVEALKPVASAWQTETVGETVVRTKAMLDGLCPVFGFCGAPWTVASYLIEGGSSEERAKAKRAVFNREPWLMLLIDRLIEESVAYLARQCACGADVLQIFDSWAGDLPGTLHAEFVVEPMAAIVRGLRALGHAQPVIGFARGIGAGHDALANQGCFAGVGLEQAVDPSWAGRTLARRVAVQGNLDPQMLQASPDRLAAEVRGICAALPAERHIFNLGHGIRPDTDPGQITHVIETVRRHDAER